MAMIGGRRDPAVARAPAGRAHDGYRAGLDGLRAVAVSLVWLSHLDAAHFPNGGIGVDIFFVLSGYLITGVVAQEHRQRGRISLRNFYIRRALRLTPALWLLLAFMLGWYAVEPRIRPGTLGAIFASATYIMNWNRIFGWMGEGWLGHCWSLAIEEQFYLVWPLLLVLLPRRWWQPAALAGAAGSAAWLLALAAAGTATNRIYNGLDCRLAGLLLGAGCALIPADPRDRLSPALGWIGAAAVAGLAALFLFAETRTPFGLAITIAADGLFAAGLVLAVDARRGEAVLAWRPVVLLGRRSYGVYLWHYPLQGMFEFYGLAGAWLLLTIPLTLAVAGLSFAFVERPLLRLKDRFAAGEGRLGVGAAAS